jgi:hypothetical protein
MMRIKYCIEPVGIIVKLLAVFIFIFPLLASAQEPIWNEYASILKRHVTPQTKQGIKLNWVDYSGLKQDPLWPKVIQRVQGYPTATLKGRKEKLAFYINAYNILAMKMVTDHWPLKSIKDVGSLFSPVWKKTAGTIDGKKVTLDQIEHKILRTMGEPRIHMSIVCASISCPDLRRKPYTAAKLNAQLDDQSASFLNNSSKGVHLSGNKIKVTKIFDWFGKDFEKLGGVKAFIGNYVNLPAGGKINGYLNYNWSVNGG